MDGRRWSPSRCGRPDQLQVHAPGVSPSCCSDNTHLATVGVTCGPTCVGYADRRPARVPRRRPTPHVPQQHSRVQLRWRYGERPGVDPGHVPRRGDRLVQSDRPSCLQPCNVVLEARAEEMLSSTTVAEAPSVAEGAVTTTSEAGVPSTSAASGATTTEPFDRSATVAVILG
jgi:hypothetical protein